MKTSLSELSPFNISVNSRPVKRARTSTESLAGASVTEKGPLISDLPAEIFFNIYQFLNLRDISCVALANRSHKILSDKYLSLYFFQHHTPSKLELCFVGYINKKCSDTELKKTLTAFHESASNGRLNPYFLDLVKHHTIDLLDAAIFRKHFQIIPDIILMTCYFSPGDLTADIKLAIGDALFHYALSKNYQPETMAKLILSKYIDHSDDSVLGIFPLFWLSGMTFLKPSADQATSSDFWDILQDRIKDHQDNALTNASVCQLSRINAYEQEILRKNGHIDIKAMITSVYPEFQSLQQRLILSNVNTALHQSREKSFQDISSILRIFDDKKCLSWFQTLNEIIKMAAAADRDDIVDEARKYTRWTTCGTNTKAFFLGCGPEQEKGKMRLAKLFSNALESDQSVRIKEKFMNLSELAKVWAGSRADDKIDSLQPLQGRVHTFCQISQYDNITLKLFDRIRSDDGILANGAAELQSKPSMSFEALRSALLTAKSNGDTEAFDAALRSVFKFPLKSGIPFYMDFGSESIDSSAHLWAEISSLHKTYRHYQEARDYVAERLGEAKFWGGTSAQLRLINLVNDQRAKRTLLEALFLTHSIAKPDNYIQILWDISSEQLKLDYPHLLTILAWWSRVSIASEYEMRLINSQIREFIRKHASGDKSVCALRAMQLFLTNQPRFLPIIAEEAWEDFASLRSSSLPKAGSGFSWETLKLLDQFMKSLVNSKFGNSNLKEKIVGRYYQEILRYHEIADSDLRHEILMILYKGGVVKPGDLNVKIDSPLTDEESSC